MVALLAVLLPVLLVPATGAATTTVPIGQPTIALAPAAPGDTMLAIAGTYHESDLTIPAGVHLSGQGPGPRSSVIDARSQGRVLTVAGGDTRVANLQLRMGAARHGGGIHVDAGNVLLADLVIDACPAQIGGAVFVGERFGRTRSP
jgi:hypothetical protein